MSRLTAIVLNTFREAIRARVLYLISFFAVLVISTSQLISLLAVGERQRIVEDLGLAAIQFFGVVCCVFLGISLLSKEIEQKTIHTVLSRPVSRSVFLLGKALGLMATVLVITGGMSLVFAVYVWLVHGSFHPALARALLLMPFEFLVVIAVALLLSAFTTPVLASLLTSVVVVIGHLSHGLKMLAELPRLSGTVAAKLSMGLYYLLPNLERFNLKTEAIHRDPVAWEQIGLSAGYGLVYAAFVLLLAIIVFERRDFV